MNFRKECESLLGETVSIAKEFPWESPEHYSLWSSQTYHFVKHSTRLFSLAAGRCPLESNNFHFRFLKHLDDEKGHENLSTNDIKILGFDLSELPELSQTKSLYQTQYYWIEHISSFSFFGYLLALEGLAVMVGPEVYERVRSTHGERASKFLKIHTEEDIGHLSEVYEWIEKMQDEDKVQVFENFKLSLDNYMTMLKAVQEYSLSSLAKAS